MNDANNTIKANLVKSVLADPTIAAHCDLHGFKVEALAIVRFHDTCESSPWFYSDVETVAYIAAICDGGRPCDAESILAQVRAEFGADCSVLW